MRGLKHIVLMGGGTGTSRVARGLLGYPVRLSIIITTADSGGSSGLLRKEFGMAPPGDARQSLGAIAAHHPLAEHLHRRFSSGGLRGHALGNVLLASLYEKYGDMQRALDVAVNIFGAEPHELIPATCEGTTLVAHLRGGRRIAGEHRITASPHIYGKLERLAILPRNAKVNPRALRALRHADAIVVGPGNFYSSILPVFLAAGISEAFVCSRAKKIFIVNLMTIRGHTDGFTPRDFLEQFERITKQKNMFDAVYYNTREIPPYFGKFARVGGSVLATSFERRDQRFVGMSLADLRRPALDPADPLASQRTLIRHDSKKLAKLIMRLVAQ